ncbi:MAG TPA: hypothetical protein VF733_03950 [Candidatus Saccharimonadales bacterium]
MAVKIENFQVNETSYQELLGECIDMALMLPGIHVQSITSAITFHEGRALTVTDRARLHWQGNAQAWNVAFSADRKPLYAPQNPAEAPILYRDIIASMNDPRVTKYDKNPRTVEYKIREFSPSAPNPIRPQVVRDCLRRATVLSWIESPQPNRFRDNDDTDNYFRLGRARHSARIYPQGTSPSIPKSIRELGLIAADLATIVRPDEVNRLRALYLLMSQHCRQQTHAYAHDWPTVSIGNAFGDQNIFVCE